MKLKTSTLVLVLLALLAAGGSVFWEMRRSAVDSKTEQPDTSAELFTFQEADVQSIALINAEGKTLQFEQTAQDFPNTWKMTQPKPMTADEAAIAFLLDQLASGQVERRLEVPVAQQQEFGLSDQSPSLRVQLKDSRVHRLVLGKETFDRTHLYALVDPATPWPDPLSVVIVPQSIATAVNRPLNEWEYQPQPSQGEGSPAVPTPAVPTPPVSPSPSPEGTTP
ncbi:DUF4340 domain-containing protein [Lyngbya confervoides]|uniref:DUF4340 domain-containing protein n=1 Tax=Lyngbya confervoides BDU141951 TaxID=1574623 RepID=A0ABD4T9W4_9CYAN|nr:DUF4340 domain-containing protein [Lyngbya confervoides]MCM1985366.1 DUF4340 domain-containing protein [Lyngbya confervoides BDU141951]